MNIDSGDIVRTTGGAGEGVGIYTLPGDGAGMVMVMVEDTLTTATMGSVRTVVGNNDGAINLNILKWR